MPGYSLADSIHVDATPRQVYDTVCDVTRAGEWSAQCVRGEWHDGDGPWGYEMEPEDGGTRLTETWHLSEAGLDVLREGFGDDAEDAIALRVSDARSGIPVTLATLKRVIEAR